MVFFLSFIRYMSQTKHAEARELMYNGALLFFSYNQVHAALPPVFCNCCIMLEHLLKYYALLCFVSLKKYFFFFLKGKKKHVIKGPMDIYCHTVFLV